MKASGLHQKWASQLYAPPSTVDYQSQYILYGLLSKVLIKYQNILTNFDLFLLHVTNTITVWSTHHIVLLLLQ